MLEIINNISIGLIAALMFTCCAWQRVRVPCLMRFLSLCIGTIAFCFLFSNKQLNFTIEGTLYRVSALIWVGWMMWIRLNKRGLFK